MHRAHLLLALILAAGCILASPGAVVTKRDPGFELSELARARVAVWPVAAAKVDPAAAKGVTEQYGSEEAFLDSLGRTLSGRLVRPGGPASLRSDQVVEQLRGAEQTRALLDSRRLVTTGAQSRFSAPPPELATLRSLRPLEGIRYALLFPEVAVDQQQTVSGGMGHTSTVRWARGRLRLAVVDIASGSVVWEGDLVASGKLSASGMKQIEEGLATAIEQRVAPASRQGSAGGPGERGSPCEGDTDCTYGVCISGMCR